MIAVKILCDGPSEVRERVELQVSGDVLKPREVLLGFESLLGNQKLFGDAARISSERHVN